MSEQNGGAKHPLTVSTQKTLSKAISRAGKGSKRVAESVSGLSQGQLFGRSFPLIVQRYPQLRFMGSKYRLLPWIHDSLTGLTFNTVLDAFAGSGCVSYLFKAMGKQVLANDFLNFSATIAKALIENSSRRISGDSLAQLLTRDPRRKRFIERTFSGIFYTQEDLRFLDSAAWNIRKLEDPQEQALAMAALIRSCVKRQPRGVFSVAGDPERYKDGRRDLQLTLKEHFIEQIVTYNEAVFDNQCNNEARKSDVFDLLVEEIDLVYLDPPYVPRADDNCYVKRYHFLEGLSCYWEGLEIVEESRVKKITKRYTPFSYRGASSEAFERLFRKFADSILVLSYSSNAFPDLHELTRLMRRYKRSVSVLERPHRYHFGTHAAVKRAEVQEYLILGS